MSGSLVRRLVDVRKWDSKPCKFQKLGSGVLSMSEHGFRKLVNVRQLGSRACKC